MSNLGIRHADRLPGLQSSTPEHSSALVNGDRRVVTATRRDRHQPTAIKLGIDLELLVARIDPLRVRQHPHLNEVQVPIVPRIHFRVPNAGARAHALGQSWIDDTLVAFRILMLHFAAQHPGDDFHVLMRMGSESGAGFDDIVVAHQQQPVMGVPRIIMVCETKAMKRVEPVHLRTEPLTVASALPLFTPGKKRKMP